jgi:hypothetical protein
LVSERLIRPDSRFGYFYFDDEPHRHSGRIAANIAKLPELLRQKDDAHRPPRAGAGVGHYRHSASTI